MAGAQAAGAAAAPAPVPPSPRRPSAATGGADDEDELGNLQAFIRNQMLNIMHPVAEHVREVQTQVQQLTKRLGGSDGRLDETKVCIEQQHQDILALQKALTLTDGQVEKLQSELGMTHREKERLGADHEVTKSDLAKIAGNLRTSNVLTKALQQKCEDLDADVRALQMGAARMGRSLIEESEKVSQTRELAEGLNSRHLDMVKSINELGRSTAEADRAVHKLSLHCEKLDGIIRSDLDRLKEHVDSLESRLGTSQHDIHSGRDQMKTIEAQLRLLKVALDADDADGTGGAAKKMTNFQNRLQRADSIMKDHGDSLEDLKKNFSNLQLLFKAHKEDNLGRCKDLEGRISDNTFHLEGLEATKEKQEDHLKKHDAVIAKAQQNLEVVSGQVDMLHLDLRGVQAAQTDVANKVELQRVQLSKTQADLRHTDSLVDTTGNSLLQLKDGLAAMDMTIAKLGSRYDNCSRSIQSMTRGLADVSKHVSQGDHGMLPPKSPHSRRLPSLGPPVVGGSLASTAQHER